MRIFKNRGDIYFSKSNKEKSAEKRILFTALIVIVVFTVLFTTILCIKNDFSAKKFFAPDEISTETAPLSDDVDIDLPDVSGKKNYMIIIYDDNTMLFSALIQSDMDTKAFKASAFKSSTQLDGNSLKGVFSSSGAENAVKLVEAGMGIDVDYYMSFSRTDFEDFFDKLGAVNYPVANEINHKEKSISPSYTLKLKAGEQKIYGRQFINLIRYYLDTEENTSKANELILSSLTQQLNSSNMDESDDLFRSFVTLAETNITIRDYSTTTDNLTVISNDRASMSVYGANAEYDGNKIKDESVKKIKGYFVK